MVALKSLKGLITDLFKFIKKQLDSVLNKIAKKHLLQFNILDTTLLMEIEGLNDPCSKRQNYVNHLEHIGLDTINAQHFYRTLDKLDQYSDLIKKQIYDTGHNLFNNQLDVVFYDVKKQKL